MTGQERREQIMEVLRKREVPTVSKDFVRLFKVSRQVIVQDIALLRAQGEKIISTSAGYMIFEKNNKRPKRVFEVKHKEDEIDDEIRTILEYGGTVLNIFVEHPIYDEIEVDLMINNKKSMEDFLEKTKQRDFKPLMVLTSGNHYHTVEAETDLVLDQIQKALNEKGYLIQASE